MCKINLFRSLVDLLHTLRKLKLTQPDKVFKIIDEDTNEIAKPLKSGLLIPEAFEIAYQALRIDGGKNEKRRIEFK